MLHNIYHISQLSKSYMLLTSTRFTYILLFSILMSYFINMAILIVLLIYYTILDICKLKFLFKVKYFCFRNFFQNFGRH